MVGHDIYLDRVTSLCSRALVGRLEYARMNKTDWVEWANTFWKPLINYIPTISLLSRGWIVFVFLEENIANVSWMVYGESARVPWSLIDGTVVLILSESA